MGHKGVAFGRVGELLFLQLHVRRHVVAGVVMRQVEHAVPHVVNACQGDELVLVTHGRKLALKLGDGRVIKVFLPVEGGRTVVGKQLVRKLLLDRLGEAPCLVQVRLGGFTPDQVGIRRIGQAARNRLIQARADLVETFMSALAGHERLVVGVAVRGQQVCRIGVGARQNNRRYAGDIGCQSRSHQFLDRFLSRNQHLATHVPTFLHRCQLIFEVHTRCTGLDHVFHQLVRIQHATKACLGIRHDGREIVDVAFVARRFTGFPLNLVSTSERVVDALDHCRHRVDRVQRLIRVHGFGRVVVGSHLPAGKVNRLNAGLDLLHGLTTGQSAHAVDEVLVRPKRGLGTLGHQIPQFVSAQSCEGVLGLNRATQADHIGCRVSTGDVFPARIFGPVFFESRHLLFACQCHLDTPRSRS